MTKKKKTRGRTRKAATTVSAHDHLAAGTLQKERIQLHERDRNVVASETVDTKLQGIDEKVQHDSNMAFEPDNVEATLFAEATSEPKLIDSKDANLVEPNTLDPEPIVMEHNNSNSGNIPDPAVHLYTCEVGSTGTFDARSPEPKIEPTVNEHLKFMEQHNSDPEDIMVNHDSNNRGDSPDTATHVYTSELVTAGTSDPEDIMVNHDSNNRGDSPDTAAHVYTSELVTAGTSDDGSPEPKIEPTVYKHLKLVEQHNWDPEAIVVNQENNESGRNPDSPAHVNTCELDTAGVTNTWSREAKIEPIDNKNLKLVDQHNPDLEGIVVNHDSNNTGINPDPSTHVYDGIKFVWAWSKEPVILVSSVLDITEGIANKVVGIVLHSNLKEMDENVVRPIFSGLDEKVFNPAIHVIVSTGLGAGDFIAKTVVSPLVSLPAVVGLIKRK